MLAAGLVALVPQANARETAKFKVLGVSGSETTVRAPASDCKVERTFDVTLKVGGTGLSEASTYVYPDIQPRDLQALDDACEVGFSASVDAPRLFPKAGLFKRKLKRLSDSDRKSEDLSGLGFEDQTVTGTTVDELKGELKRKKIR